MEFDDFMYKLKDGIIAVEGKRHRLIIVLGDEKIKSFLKKMEITCINLNLILSEKLLNMKSNRRSRVVGSMVRDILRNYEDEVIAITDCEILYLPELNQDPLRLFEELSRDRTIILLWKGRYDNDILTYAEPWHREYHEYTNIDAEIIKS